MNTETFKQDIAYGATLLALAVTLVPSTPGIVRYILAGLLGVFGAIITVKAVRAKKAKPKPMNEA